MDKNKTWHEKFGMWIAIAAGICTILSFVFMLKPSDDNDRGSNSSINIDGNNDGSVINDGDYNTITIINGNYNVNNENGNSDATMSVESEEFKVVASYDKNIEPNPQNGIDVLIKAETAFAAEKVTIMAIPNTTNEIYDMHGGPYSWSFKANFYVKGEYTIIITAYNAEGESVSDEFTYVY